MGQWQNDLIDKLSAPLPIEPIISPLPVTETNPQPTGAALFGPSTATHAVATVTAVSSVVLPSNPARRRFMVYNDSGAAIFVMFGPVASISAFSFRLTPNELFNAPLGCYTGEISAVRASGTGALQVTEIVMPA